MKLIYRVNSTQKTFIEYIQEFKEFVGVPEEEHESDEAIMMDGLGKLLNDSFLTQNKDKRKIHFQPPSAKGKINEFAPRLPKLASEPKI